MIRAATVAIAMALVSCADLLGPGNSWDETMDVLPGTVACVGVFPQQCLRVREFLILPPCRELNPSKCPAVSPPDSTFYLFYDNIEGFTFEPSNYYTLRVRVTKVDIGLLQDASSRRYKLLEVLSKLPAPSNRASP